MTEKNYSFLHLTNSVTRTETDPKEDSELSKILRDIIERLGSVEACKNVAEEFNSPLDYMYEQKLKKQLSL